MSYNGHSLIPTVRPKIGYALNTQISDYIINLKQDHHHEPATRGAQPYAKRVDLRVGIMEIAISKTFEIGHGRRSRMIIVGDVLRKWVRDVWHGSRGWGADVLYTLSGKRVQMLCTY
jgi:hypothetical protein